MHLHLLTSPTSQWIVDLQLPSGCVCDENMGGWDLFALPTHWQARWDYKFTMEGVGPRNAAASRVGPFRVGDLL